MPCPDAALTQFLTFPAVSSLVPVYEQISRAVILIHVEGHLGESSLGVVIAPVPFLHPFYCVAAKGGVGVSKKERSGLVGPGFTYTFTFFFSLYSSH